MKFLIAVLLISSAQAVEIEVVVDGAKVNPESVLLEVGDKVDITAEGKDSQGKPALIDISEFHANQSFGQELSRWWDSYKLSPSAASYVVSKKNADRGSFSVYINVKDEDGVGKYHTSESDEQIAIEMKVLKTLKEYDLSPARITKLTVSRNGQILDPSTAILRVGDEIVAKLEAEATDGSNVRGKLEAYDSSEPLYQNILEVGSLFILPRVPIEKKFRVTKENALDGEMRVYGSVRDGDLLGLEKYNGMDDFRSITFSVEKIKSKTDETPSSIQKVTVTIQKKNGNIVDASAKPQVFDGAIGKGGPSAPGKKSPGAGGAKAQ